MIQDASGWKAIFNDLLYKVKPIVFHAEKNLPEKGVTRKLLDAADYDYMPHTGYYLDAGMTKPKNPSIKIIPPK